ncbi:MAG TPA: SCO1664 family protein [Candidatus Nanopelagicaceae bacterium]|nr:SCO1664 family protein [Candidatus Nanopelagicaceae bacterium]
MKEQNRTVIREGEIEIAGRLVAASNATLFGYATLDLHRVSIIYKPIAGERPLWDFTSGSLAGREVSAFLISEALGWDLVPFTTFRNGPFGEGMVQQWIDIDEAVDPLALVAHAHLDLRRMVLFDAVINNTDRKFGHLLPTADGRVRGCDHGVSFHIDDKLRTVLWNWAGEIIAENDLADLKALAQSIAKVDLHDGLSQFLTEEEISLTENRIRKLLETGCYPTPGTEWPAVPWPPF